MKKLARASVGLLVLCSPALALPAYSASIVNDIPTGKDPMWLAMAPSGTSLYVANRYSFDVAVVDTGSNQVSARFTTPRNEAVESIVVSPDSRTLYAGYGVGPGKVAFVATGSLTITKEIELGEQVYTLAVSRDGESLYAAVFDGRSMSVQRLDALNGEVLGTTPMRTGLGSINVSPGGDVIYATDPGKGSVVVIDTSSMTVRQSIKIASSIGPATLSPAGDRLYVSHGSSQGLSVVDTRTNQVTSKWLVPGALRQAVSPDGRTLYAIQLSSGLLDRIDTATGTVNGRMKVGGDAVDIALEPTGQRLYITRSTRGDVAVIHPFRIPDLYIKATCTRAKKTSTPAIRCIGTSKGLKPGSRLDLAIQSGGARWETLPSKYSPSVASNGTFAMTFPAPATRQVKVRFAGGGINSDSVTVR
jgi:YVTN family beta-propeller protein